MSDKVVLKFKVCLLGNPGVGKTSLIQKYVHDFFGDVYIRTMGTKVSRKVIKIENEKDNKTYEVGMMIWDIMGQKIQSVLHKTYFKFSKGALIVCDSTRKNTLLDTEDWVNNLFEVTENIPIVFLANKYDLKNEKTISDDDLKEIADKYNSPYFFTSAKTGENVNRAFHKLGKVMLENAMIAKEKKVEEKKVEPAGIPVAQAVPGSNYEEVKSGGSYLIKEEKPVKSFRIFNKMVSTGSKGFCITRTHPNMVQNTYQLEDVPMKWLTSGEPDENTLAPTLLSEVSTVITNYIQKNSNSVILLEGIEYLIDHNDFKSVLKLVHSINDAIMRSDSVFLITLDPYILDKKELHILSRDLIPIS